MVLLLTALGLLSIGIELDKRLPRVGVAASASRLAIRSALAMAAPVLILLKVVAATEVNRWVATSLFFTMCSLRKSARSPRRRPGWLLTWRRAPSARRPCSPASADDDGMNASPPPVRDSLAGGILGGADD